MNSQQVVGVLSFQVPYGVTVQLDDNGDRIESYSMMNYVMTRESTMETVPVGMFDSISKSYRSTPQPLAALDSH